MLKTRNCELSQERFQLENRLIIIILYETKDFRKDIKEQVGEVLIYGISELLR